MQDHTVTGIHPDWNNTDSGNTVRIDLDGPPDGLENNPYLAPMVRESKRTNFENAQFKLGELMDERYNVSMH